MDVIYINLLILGLMLPLTATAAEGTGYLKSETDVYLEVYDFDDDGNRGGNLWQGRLYQGKTVMLKAHHGLFSYDYNDQPDEDQPLRHNGNFSVYPAPVQRQAKSSQAGSIDRRTPLFGHSAAWLHYH